MSIALGLLGCSDRTDDLPRLAISGTVTLDGKPLERGTIRFEPKPANRQPVQAFGPIEGGGFAIPSAVGPTPGSYAVVISSASQEATDLEDDPARKVVVKPDPIPPRYNRRSTLTAEVAAEGPSAFEFPLTSKP